MYITLSRVISLGLTTLSILDLIPILSIKNTILKSSIVSSMLKIGIKSIMLNVIEPQEIITERVTHTQAHYDTELILAAKTERTRLSIMIFNK